MSRTVRIKGKEHRDRGSVDLDAVEVRLPDGTRLSEARAQELVQEIYEKAHGGRPSLTKPGVRSPQLHFALPAELKEQLQARADAEHRTASALAREALERYLAS